MLEMEETVQRDSFRETNRLEKTIGQEDTDRQVETNRHEVETNRHEIETNRHEIETNRHEIEINRHEIETNRHEEENPELGKNEKDKHRETETNRSLETNQQMVTDRQMALDRQVETTRPPLPEQREGYRPFYKEKKKKVGQYMLTDPLAEGTFGRYRYGVHLLTNQKVAVKILDKKVVTRREIARRCLRREGLVLQKLNHPNIVRMYEAMETRKSYYLVFELVDGESFLEFLIKKRCLLETEARLFTREIVSAVDHMHVSGIIHRDLRLENFLLDSRKRIKITGFGIAVLENEAPLPSNRCGSPAYAAPEVFSCRKQGPGVDIWSIGVCLFAMLIGHLPFLPAKMVSLPEIHSLVLKGVTIPTFLSKDCHNLISRMLKPYLCERITMEELLRHNWLLVTGEKHVPRQPPVSKIEPPLVDHRLVEYINYMHGFHKESIINSVQDRRMDNVSATYHLYVKSIQNGFKVPEVSELLLSRHDTAEDFLQSTQSRIIHEYIDNLLAETESPRIDGVRLSPQQSVPLYKSCITCLQDTRCHRHGPDDVNVTSIGPRCNMATGNVSNRYLHVDISAQIKKYLIDSEIQSIQELRQTNPDLFLDVGGDVKLPDVNTKYFCQQETPKGLIDRKQSSASLPLTPPNSCHGNVSPRRPYSVHSCTGSHRQEKHRSIDANDMSGFLFSNGDEKEKIIVTENAQHPNDNKLEQKTHQEDELTVQGKNHMEEKEDEGHMGEKRKEHIVEKDEEYMSNKKKEEHNVEKKGEGHIVEKGEEGHRVEKKGEGHNVEKKGEGHNVEKMEEHDVEKKGEEHRVEKEEGHSAEKKGEEHNVEKEEEHNVEKKEGEMRQKIEGISQEEDVTQQKDGEKVQKKDVSIQAGGETDTRGGTSVKETDARQSYEDINQEGEETLVKEEEPIQKGEGTIIKEETGQEKKRAFHHTRDEELLNTDGDNDHDHGDTAAEVQNSNQSKPSSPHSNNNGRHVLNVTMETRDLNSNYTNRLQDDLNKTNSSLTCVSKNVCEETSTANGLELGDLDLKEKRSPLCDLDPDKGLRDPYAEEIWVAMYPRTNKINTHFNVSPRIPISFSPSLSSRKPLTSRRPGNANPSLTIFRKMASGFHSNNLTPIVDSCRYNSFNRQTPLPNIPTITSPRCSSSSPLDGASTWSGSRSSTEAIISVVVKASTTS